MRPWSLIVLLTALAACAGPDAEWRTAQSKGTVEAYEEYLRDNPQGRYAPEAQQRLRELEDERDWQRAQTLNTPEAFQRYLSRWPDGRQAESARGRLADFVFANGPAGDAPVAAPTGLPPIRGSAAPYVAPEPRPASGMSADGPNVSSAPAAPIEAAPAVAPPAAAISAPAPAVTANPAARYALQLGAFGTGEPAARAAWSRLVAAHPAELANLQPRVERVSRDGQTLWRLTAGSLAEADARARCARLAQAGAGCVIAPLAADARVRN